MNKPYQALIFDWDGTLADSTSTIVQAVQAAFQDNDLPPPSNEAAQHIIGLALPKAMAYLAPTASELQLQNLAEAYEL